jgi:hypothetical protein
MITIICSIIVSIVTLIITIYLDVCKIYGGNVENALKELKHKLEALPNYPIPTGNRNVIFKKMGPDQYMIDPEYAKNQYEYTRESSYGFKTTIDFLLAKLEDDRIGEDINRRIAINCMRCYSTDAYVHINMVSRLLEMDNVNTMTLDMVKDQFKMRALNTMEERAISDTYIKDILTRLKGEKWREGIEKAIKQNIAITRMKTFPEWKDWLADLTKEPLEKPLYKHLSAELIPTYMELYDPKFISDTIGEMSILEIFTSMLSFMNSYYIYAKVSSFPSIMVARADWGNINLWCKKDQSIKNFVSTTYDLTGNGPNYDMYGGNYLSYICLPAGLKSFYMVAISSYSNESEILMPFIGMGRWLPIDANKILDHKTIDTGYNSDGHTLRKVYPKKPSDNATIAIVTDFSHPQMDGTFFVSNGKNVEYKNPSLLQEDIGNIGNFSFQTQSGGGDKLGINLVLKMIVSDIFGGPNPETLSNGIDLLKRRIHVINDISSEYSYHMDAFMQQLINDMKRMRGSKRSVYRSSN